MKGPQNTMENSCRQEPGSLTQQEQPADQYNNSYGISNHNGSNVDVSEITDQVNWFTYLMQKSIDLRRLEWHWV